MLAQLALDCRNMHGEGIQWDPLTGFVWWTDIERRALHWFSPGMRQSGSFALADRLCGLAPRGRGRGRWIFAFSSGVELWDDGFKCEQRLHEFEPDNSETRLNDGRTQRQGRFVVGWMNEKSGGANSSVIRINGDPSAETLFACVSCANSTCSSLDGAKMYFADTAERSIRVYEYGYRLTDFEAHCNISGEPGLPDGCVDAECGVWNAAREGGQVVRIDRGGNPTTSRLGSTQEDLGRYPLSGSLFEFRPEMQGVEDLPFAA